MYQLVKAQLAAENVSESTAAAENVSESTVSDICPCQSVYSSILCSEFVEFLA